ncbi:rubrerythrin family protein [Haloterrigena sp. SYSU A121-1]|uniref:Rubrerythrin family protein n=1 Tax=Haloterrigena gelatinilytica TaxID=2741724 RepID=A0A8J8KHW0_9EURY|nr:rubrerythrin family protein [Haloterrigena gelatinilytica]NUB91619.1 rubrerythrin family protein [Haloterrigena gelatinilytica]
MDADGFRDAVEDSMDSELERLGSSKLLVALTDADLTAETVLRTVADGERAAMETFEDWADDEGHEDAQELFAEFRDQERDHYERVADLLEGEGDADATGGPMHETLRSLEDATARLGGLVGRSMVGERMHLQVVSFFVNEGDERRAEQFRELRSETAAQGDRALELLEDVCDEDGDWDRARDATEEVIEIAYDAYAGSLDEMGIDPKPIC